MESGGGGGGGSDRGGCSLKRKKNKLCAPCFFLLEAFEVFFVCKNYLCFYLLFLFPICMATLSKKFDFLIFYRVDDFILWNMWQVGIRVSTEPCFLIIILRPIVSLQKVAMHSQICPFRFQFFNSWNISTHLTR